MKRTIFFLLPIILLIALSTTLPGDELSTYEKLLNTAREKGSARIIIKLDVKNLKALTEKSTEYKVIEPGLSFPAGGIQADLDLQQAIDTATYSVLYQLNGKAYRLNHTYSTLPYLALEVSPETLALLPTLPQVLDIFEDKPRPLIEYLKVEKKPLENPFPTDSNDSPDHPMLTTSVALIGAKTAWSMGYTGAGWYVAILDTGIRSTHEFFAGKTIKEACFSALSDCPNGNTEMYGTGAAAHYESTYYGYDHGTHVSGIAAGKTSTLKGVAKDSKILAVQVFSRFSASDCDGDPCVMSYDSDQVKGLEYVYSLRSTYSIAAVNMSLGGGSYSSYCNGEPQQPAINNLKSVRIATAVATGNDYNCGAISSPACIPAAVAVGASNDSDIEAAFSNWNETLLELFAPGVNIYSSTGDSDSSYDSWSGTSMATPHVTGAWALLRQASSSSSVDAILTALQDTGPPVETLCGGGGSRPRIEVDDAIDRLLGNTDSITVTAPNGGEKWGIGSTYAVTWTSSGSVSNVKIEYSTDNGAKWSTIIASTINTGTYNWTVPNKPSTKCKVRISDAADSRPSDTGNSTFSIVTVTNPTLTVTSPNGGEKWDTGTVHNITWTTTGSVGNVKIEYSSNNGGNWTLVSGSTTNDGSYSWTVPNTASTACRIRISEASDGSPTDTSNAVFSIIIPIISLNRTQFYYGAIVGGAVTGSQALRIDNKGGGTLQWTALANNSWIITSPASGTNSGESAMSAAPGTLGIGSYTGSVTVAASGASNTPQTVNVQLTVKDAAQDEAPFGSFDSPTDGSAVRGSFALTGWALDDVGVASVKIYRQDNGNPIYIGDALLVEGARPDVENLYPQTPQSYKAGWGYMLLSYFLPDGGNGVYVLTAIATDLSGKQTTLGSKTITVDNVNAVKPFGAIDNPVPGGEVSGSQYRNSGWALTPLPNMIPTDGSTMSVYIDGVNKGHPVYNIYRADIASLFPGYLNSGGAHGYFKFDTTAYKNGIHTIAWTATDNADNAEGIGSRYFIVQNTGADMAHGGEPSCLLINARWSPIPNTDGSMVGVIKGYREDAAPQTVYPNENGIIAVEIKELERVEIHFPASPVNNVSPLPIGSTLDKEKGVFYWNPGPGFLGDYELVFADNFGNHSKRVKIKILPGQ